MPVKYGSSQPPSGRWDSTSHRTARSTASPALAGGMKGEQRPRRLRRGRRAATAPVGLAVGAEVLAEPAVGVLHALEPRDRAAHARVLREPARGECGDDRADAVDVVRAPAAEPRAVRLLLAQQVLDAGARLRGLREPLVREQLDHVRGDVGARRVGDGAEVAERQPRAASLVFSTSNAPQPPSLLCIPSAQVSPRVAGPANVSPAARRSASTTTAVSSTSG